MIRPISILGAACKVLAVTALLPLQGFGCGLDFKVPKDHFDGVNEFGYVSYWDKIGDLDLGEGLSIPLVIGFQSDREWSSPYLGYGWIMPLFDSNLVQTGENSFEMIAPDGYTVEFGRDGKKPTVLNGQRGLKGEISGDTITLWTSCGWKLSYTKGKITSIGTPKGKTLLIGRDATGVARDVSYDGKVVIRVERDFKGLVTGLDLGDKHIEFEQTEKPRIQSILGKNVVAGKDMSLGKVTSENGVIKTCEYNVSDGLQPKLTVSDAGKPPRQIAWDSKTRFIAKDNGWNYNIIPAEYRGGNAAIRRVSSVGQKEFWHYDALQAQEISQSSTGLEKSIRWFASGIFAGKIRTISLNDGNGSQRALLYSYDIHGHLVRISQSLKSKTNPAFEDSSKIIWSIEERDTQMKNAYVIRNSSKYELLAPGSPEFPVAIANLFNLIGDRVTIARETINQIQVARLPNGSIAYRVLSKNNNLLLSCIDSTIYWPRKNATL